MKYNDVTNYHSRLKQQLAWEQYIVERGFTHYLTFNFNFHEETCISSARRKLIRFGMLINRELHGMNFTKKPHIWFVAFPEHLNSNLHFHVALTAPDIQGFNEKALGIWSKIVKSGSIHIEQKDFSETDVRKIAAYITKDIGFGKNSEHSVFFA